MQDRVPPQNIEAEQSVLGAMLIEKEAIPRSWRSCGILIFTVRRTASFLTAMLELYNKNEAVDMITVTGDSGSVTTSWRMWAVSLMSLRWLMLCRLRPT